MRVIHLNLERGWRGGERQVFLLARELAATGVEQTVYGRLGCPLLERLRDLPVRLEAVPGRLAALLRLRREPRPAVLHAHTGNTVPLAVLARRPGDLVVATRRMELPVNPFWWSRADKVAAVSRGVVAALAASGVEGGRVIRIPSGVDLSRRLDPGLRNGLRRDLGVPPMSPLGLTVAALEEEKNPLTMARAAALLPADYHHLWVGDGKLAREMQAEIDRLGIGGRFHLAGFDPQPDRWFAAADLFVLPSRHEGLGSVLLDAFHFGLPVVGARIAGTAELLEDGLSALLFTPGEPASLAAAVRRLLDDPALGERLRAEGRRRVAAYDIHATARAYLDLYRLLPARPG